MNIVSIEDSKFPVQIENISNLTGLNVVNKERQSVVIGDFNNTRNILGIHSKRYSLITNEMLLDTIEEALYKSPVTYDVSVSTYQMMQFNIQVAFADYSKTIGNEKDAITCAFNLKNAYDGKLKFGLYGVGKQKKSKVSEAYRLSTFRQICSNGLHGWVDEAISLDEYITGIKTGKNVKKVFIDTDISENKFDVNFTQKHSGIDLKVLKENLIEQITALVELYQKAVSGVANTVQVYSDMANFNISDSKLFLNAITDKVGTSLSRNSFDEIIKIMDRERTILGEGGDTNAWLLYNGINRFASDSKKSITQHLQADEKIFTAILEEVYA
jgi:hypothetical protein